VKERPILYNDEMVRAILAGRKTQTRRPMATKRIYATGGTLDETWYSIGRGLCILMRKDHTWPNTVLQYCPFGAVADVLWVRESARVIDIRDSGHWGKDCEVRLQYRADERHTGWIRWPERLKPPTLGHCVANGVFREGSRLRQRITNVRVERIWAITERDAQAEGFPSTYPYETARGYFATTWDAIYGGTDPKTGKPRWSSWGSNPFVWVIETQLQPLDSRENAPT